jgi:hypothetical protein
LVASKKTCGFEPLACFLDLVAAVGAVVCH